MRGIVRINDLTVGNCSVHGSNIGGKIITASNNTHANNRSIARLGDIVQADCGHTAIVITASSSSFANNRGVARVGDLVGSSPYTGQIVTGSSDTFTN